MTTPTIIFDHVHNAVAVSGSDPKASEALAATLDAERQTITAAAGSPPEK